MPDRIKKLFKNTEYPAEGVFDLVFKSKGKDVSIVVDDLLPVISSWKLPFSAEISKTNGAWWMPILEKAYAKFNVYYSNLYYIKSALTFR